MTSKSVRVALEEGGAHFEFYRSPFPMAREGVWKMLTVARTICRSEKRNKHGTGKETPQSPDLLPAHGRYYMPAVGPVKRHVHHGNSLCDAHEPVCLHENTPGELAPPKLIRPGAFV